MDGEAAWYLLGRFAASSFSWWLLEIPGVDLEFEAAERVATEK
jgi:hypothetical protein